MIKNMFFVLGLCMSFQVFSLDAEEPSYPQDFRFSQPLLEDYLKRSRKFDEEERAITADRVFKLTLGLSGLVVTPIFLLAEEFIPGGNNNSNRLASSLYMLAVSYCAASGTKEAFLGNEVGVVAAAAAAVGCMGIKLVF